MSDPTANMSDATSGEFKFSKVTVLDGSMGKLLMDNGVPDDPKLWSARALLEEQYHSNVVEAHRSYIRAGATAITTCNFPVQPNYYRKVFEDWQERIPKDTETAARLAVEARSRESAGDRVQVLGCLPPICESHRPDLTNQFIAAEGRDFCVKTYRTIAESLLRGGPVDAFLAETINNWEEAECVIEAVQDLNKPLLLAMEGNVRNAELKPQPQEAARIAEKVIAAKNSGARIEVLAFNCAPPENIVACLQAVKEQGLDEKLHSAGIQLGGYANCNDRKKVHDSGFSADGFSAAAIKVKDEYVGSGFLGFCKQYHQCSATFLGGCCGSTPEEIRMIAASFAPPNPQLSRKRALDETTESPVWRYGGGRLTRGPCIAAQ